MSKHIKRGIVCGIVIAVVLSIIAVMSNSRRDQSYWSTAFNGLGQLLFPVFALWDAFFEVIGVSGCMVMGFVPLMLASFFLYFFALVFGVIWCISRLAEKLASATAGSKLASSD